MLFTKQMEILLSTAITALATTRGGKEKKYIHT